MTNFIILTDKYGLQLLKDADLMTKAVYPIQDNLTRVWFSDGEGIECIETPKQILEKINIEC